jgi:hypothetical protein
LKSAKSELADTFPEKNYSRAEGVLSQPTTKDEFCQSILRSALRKEAAVPTSSEIGSSQTFSVIAKGDS